MIGRLLSESELQWVFAQSERLRASGFAATHADCLRDPAYAGIEADWQALVLGDMVFLAQSL
jgi:hypothetical protein